jgi:hypothetical protein
VNRLPPQILGVAQLGIESHTDLIPVADLAFRRRRAGHTPGPLLRMRTNHGTETGWGRVEIFLLAPGQLPIEEVASTPEAERLDP